MVLLTVLVVGAGGAAVAGTAGWKDYIKPQIEKQIVSLVRKLGPNFLCGAKCELEQVSLELGGITTIAFSGLKIFNLPPYSEGELMKLDKVVVVVDVKGTTKSKLKVVQLSELNVAGCHVAWEKNLLSSNVDTFLEKLKDNQTGKEAKEEDKHEADTKDTTQERSVALGSVAMSGVMAKIAPHVQEGKSSLGAEIPVPPIKIDQFSEKYGGVTLQKLIVLLFTDILQGASKAVVSFTALPAQGAENFVESAVAKTGGKNFDTTSWCFSWFFSSKKEQD
mmetsp:Transcript_107298/g.269032  ORF Transcript_107298/g.269032 Transcript_107298/m.269032 type:complete len:278 (+) Transcript_107298:70-903(+)